MDLSDLLSEPNRLALVEIDHQDWVLALGHRDPIEAAGAVRALVRQAGALVVCTRYLGPLPDEAAATDGSSAFAPGLAPAPGDLVLTKYGVDVTDNPDVVDNLRLRGIERVLLTGALTEHGVAAAARSLLVAGFEVGVVGAACAGASAAGHAAALDELAVAGVPVVDLT
ncbi:cysteine hydrolase family protein [Nocardioides sp. GXZ039]|uniref:cysteine hydrolase family protein n=1 Tax=Nocardioides sp. GXZ039 TaxID=3136018 RepID=UPI0030F47B94